MTNGFGAHARSLSAEFGQRSEEYRILCRTFEQALLDPNQRVREHSQQHLVNSVIGYNSVVGRSFLIPHYNQLSWNYRVLFVHLDQFEEVVLAGNEVYTILTNTDNKRTLAHVQDLSFKRLEAEGLAVHPFSFKAVRQVQQGLHL